MTDSNRQKVYHFLLSLEEALGESNRQTGDIVAEVRADLAAHVERYRAGGRSEEEAVEAAIAEMGNPFELAHHMRREIPPFGGTALTTIRYVAASAVGLWTLLMLWVMRPGVYGFSPTLLAIVVLLHLPAILLLWPRIVWRKNWLFGLIPAGIGLAVAMFASIGGVENSSTELILIPENGEAPMVQAPTFAPSDTGPSKTRPVLVATALGVVAVVLFMAMQRASQRRIALLVLLLGAGLVEAAYQVEEALFRRDRQRARDYLETSVREHGAYPDEETIKSKGPKLGGRHSLIRVADRNFSLSWSRPLSSGHSIIYTSADDRVRVQD